MTSVPSWARVGAKVVCIDDSAARRIVEGEQMPVKGRIYTIREVYVHPVELETCARLVEIVNPHRNYALGIMECSYKLRRFRPLITVTLEQDVAMFKAIVHDAPIHEPAQ